MAKDEIEDKVTVGDKDTSTVDEKSFERDKFLWDVIKRIDFYIGTTNTKAAFLIPFNTFIFATIVLQYKQWPDFLGPNHLLLQTIGQGLLALIALACLFSLIPTFLTINPFMKGDTDKSLLFYRDIATMTVNDYNIKIQTLERATAVSDMAKQAYALSQGVTHKFWLLRVATVAVLAELIGLASLLVFKIFSIVLSAWAVYSVR